MLLVYWLDDNPQYGKRVAAIHSRMLERQDELITSAVTLGEVLAGAYRKGPQARAAEIREALLSLVDEVIPFTVETADSYARIRGTGGVAASDAIHLSCAATARTDLLLTNDTKLLGKFVPGIQFIASLDTQFF